VRHLAVLLLFPALAFARDVMKPWPDGPPSAEDLAELSLGGVLKNPKALSAIFSTEICIAQAMRKAALDAPAKWRHNRIRKIDEMIASSRARLRAHKLRRKIKLLPCSTQIVQTLMACKGKDPADECQDPRVRLPLSLVMTIDDDQ
jgi:hypothetical protein